MIMCIRILMRWRNVIAIIQRVAWDTFLDRKELELVPYACTQGHDVKQITFSILA